MTRSPIFRTGAAIAALLLAACSGDLPVGPNDGPARYDLRLDSPNAADAGLLLDVVGPVDSVTPPAGSAATVIVVERLLAVNAQTRKSEWVTRLVLAGEVRPGSVATVWTSSSASIPVAALEQVSAPDTWAQRALAGYSLSLVRLGTRR